MFHINLLSVMKAIHVNRSPATGDLACAVASSASKFLLWKLIFIAVCLRQWKPNRQNKQNGLWAVCLDETRTSKALSACAAFAALAIKTRKKQCFHTLAFLHTIWQKNFLIKGNISCACDTRELLINYLRGMERKLKCPESL